MLERVKRYFSEFSAVASCEWNAFWFSTADARPLAVLRILLGILAFLWCASYTPHLTAWFGPDGMIPKELMEAMGFNQPFHWSILSFANTPVELYVIHSLSLLVLASFTLGYMTRVSSILSFMVVVSYIHRGPMIVSHQEPVLSFLMLYLCLAPAGAYYSVDRLIRRRESGRTVMANLATRLAQVHLTAFYLMMGLNKLGGEAWWSGDAVWWLAARPESRLFEWTFLDNQVMLVNAWSLAIVVFELTFPILVWNRWLRPLMIGLSVIMWGLMAVLTNSLGFCATMVVANLVFVSPSLLSDLTSRKDVAKLDEGASPEHGELVASR